MYVISPSTLREQFTISLAKGKYHTGEDVRESWFSFLVKSLIGLKENENGKKKLQKN
jgi:hypothetical protein